MKPIRTLFENRALDALAKSLICFALLHQILLMVHVARGGSLDALNVFTMLDAERLAPALGQGFSAQLLSGLFALLVYLVVLALWTRPRAGDTAQRRLTIGLFRPSLASGVTMFVGGLAVHCVCLTGIELLTSHFPSVPDVLMARLPYVAFGLPGELAFVAFLIAVSTVLIRAQSSAIPAVLSKLGLFYAFRGLFLFFLPIGSPADAPALGSRFVLYPWANHAYFPGGHVGLMTILSLSVQDRRWRRGLLVATGLFAFGTLLARTHYTADALGGWLLAYAITSWGRRHIAARVASTSPPLMVSAREEDLAATRAEVAGR